METETLTRETVEIIPSPIDWKKPVRTKGGNHYPVRILAVHHGLQQPIIGVIEAEHLSQEASAWSLAGHFNPRGVPGCLDLENYDPEPAKPDPRDASLGQIIRIVKTLRFDGAEVTATKLDTILDSAEEALRAARALPVGEGAGT